ncbi:MAG TPA: S1/P1 nuclease [Candidatus Ozemobacteraceae bacterium]
MTIARVACLLAACLIPLCPIAAGAWSGPGHRVIALLAADILRVEAPAAYDEARRLLESERDDRPGDDGRHPRKATLVSVAGWADHVRPKRPETAHYHIVEIPFTAGGYDEARDGAGEKHIIHAVDTMTRILGNTGRTDGERLEALKFLVHLVGDLHQPLHCTNRGDAGGNARMVILDGEEMKLHHVWDFRIVDSFGMNERQLAGILQQELRATDTAAIATGTLVDWVNESHHLGQAWGYAFEPGSVITPDWLASVRPVVKQQLLRAGVRLARLLREALDRPSSCPVASRTDIIREDTP